MPMTLAHEVNLDPNAADEVQWGVSERGEPVLHLSVGSHRVTVAMPREQALRLCEVGIYSVIHIDNVLAEHQTKKRMVILGGSGHA